MKEQQELREVVEEVQIENEELKAGVSPSEIENDRDDIPLSEEEQKELKKVSCQLLMSSRNHGFGSPSEFLSFSS